MDSRLRPSPMQQKVKFGCLYASFSFVGFVLAFWYGLGWFILLQTMRILFFTIPQLHLPVMQIVFGLEFTEEWRRAKLEKKSRWYSVSSILTPVLMIMLTILFFWKINIPLIDLLNMIINS